MITDAQQSRAFEVTPEGKVAWEYTHLWDADRVVWLNDAQAFDPLTSRFRVGAAPQTKRTFSNKKRAEFPHPRLRSV